MGYLMNAITLFNLVILFIQVVILFIAFKGKTKTLTSILYITIVEYLIVLVILSLLEGNYNLGVILVSLVNNIIILLYVTVTSNTNLKEDKEFYVYGGLLYSVWILGNLTHLALFVKTI